MKYPGTAVIALSVAIHVIASPVVSAQTTAERYREASIFRLQQYRLQFDTMVIYMRDECQLEDSLLERIEDFLDGPAIFNDRSNRIDTYLVATATMVEERIATNGMELDDAERSSSAELSDVRPIRRSIDSSSPVYFVHLFQDTEEPVMFPAHSQSDAGLIEPEPESAEEQPSADGRLEVINDPELAETGGATGVESGDAISPDVSREAAENVEVDVVMAEEILSTDHSITASSSESGADAAAERSVSNDGTGPAVDEPHLAPTPAAEEVQPEEETNGGEAHQNADGVTTASSSYESDVTQSTESAPDTTQHSIVAYNDLPAAVVESNVFTFFNHYGDWQELELNMDSQNYIILIMRDYARWELLLNNSITRAEAQEAFCFDAAMPMYENLGVRARRDYNPTRFRFRPQNDRHIRIDGRYEILQREFTVRTVPNADVDVVRRRIESNAQLDLAIPLELLEHQVRRNRAELTSRYVVFDPVGSLYTLLRDSGEVFVGVDLYQQF